MSFGIHDIDVEKNEDTGEFLRVRVRFGDGHELQVSAKDGQSCLELQGKAVSITLAAAGPLCEYERAVNLLRLHMARNRDV